MGKKIFLIGCLTFVAFFGHLCCVKNTAFALSNKTVYIDEIGPVSRSDQKIVSDLVKKTIQNGLNGQPVDYPDLSKYPLQLSSMKKVYITLKIGDKLLGRWGNEEQERPLLHAIVDSVYNAAFKDLRFSDLTQKELESPDFYFYVSVLSEEKDLVFQNEQDIIRQLKPFQSGLTLTYQSKDGERTKAVLLPEDWMENPDPQQFWVRLKEEAGLAGDFFSNQFKVRSFTSETIRDWDFMTQQDEKRIQMAVKAFQKLFQPDGHIQYEIDFETGEKSDLNHLVREMGSGYALSYAYYMTHDQSSVPFLIRFLNYVKNTTVPYQDGLLVADNPDWIFSGASSLALLAVLYYEQESQDTSFQQLREGLKNGLVALFEPGIGIHQSPRETKTSPYYDGETWLALTGYHIFHPEDEALAQLIPVLNQTMYDKYANEYMYQFFHWGTQAAAHQFGYNQDPLMYDFLKKQLDIYIDTIDFHAGSSSCAYAEGLGQSALALRGRDDKLYLKVLARLENQIDVVRLLQDAPFKAEKAGRLSSRTKSLLGLFLNTVNDLKTRNDVTQHCLSALLKAQQVFREVP